MKLNKHLIAFAGMFLGLNAILFTVLQKYFLLLLHHIVYYCQEMAKPLSINVPGNIGIIVFSFLLAILLATTIKLILTVNKMYGFRNNLDKNIVKNLQIVSLLDKINLRSKVFVVNSSKPFAFCFGIRQPKIYVSTKLIEILSEAELETVLRHENYHLENRDAFTLMLAAIFESLLPYFPLFSDIIHRYRIERELLADQVAISGLGGKKHLIAVLTKLLAHEPPRFVFTGVPAIADAENLEARIKKLTNKRFVYRKFYWKNIVISFASVGFLLALIFTPVNAVEFHDKGKDVMILCPQNQTCKNWCGTQN